MDHSQPLTKKVTTSPQRADNRPRNNTHGLYEHREKYGETPNQNTSYQHRQSTKQTESTGILHI